MNVYGLDPLPRVLGRVGCIRMSWPRYETEPLRTAVQSPVGPGTKQKVQNHYVVRTAVQLQSPVGVAPLSLDILLASCEVTLLLLTLPSEGILLLKILVDPWN